MGWTNTGLQIYLSRGIEHAPNGVAKARLIGDTNGGTQINQTIDTKTILWNSPQLVSGVNEISQESTTIFDVTVGTSEDQTEIKKIQLLGHDDAVLFEANLPSVLIFNVSGTVSMPKLKVKYTQNSVSVTI